MPAPLTRRQFLKVSASATGSAIVLGALPGLLTSNKVAALQESLVTSTDDRIMPGVCLLCPSGCGTITRVADGKAVKLEGNPMHPINQGTLCPKGQAALELLYNPDRLTQPIQRVGDRGAGGWHPISWDEAVNIVSDKLKVLRAKHQPQAAVLMHGEARGQLQPFFERFMRTFGSPNTISFESLNISAAKLGMYLTQGVYNLPAYDLENSRYVLSFGSGLLEAGPFPQRMISGYGFLRRGRAERGKVVVIDPRQGVSGAKADEWIPINPGTDAALALSMANVIIRAGLVDSDFVNNYSFGYDDFPDESGTFLHQGFKSFVLDNYDPEKVEDIIGISATTISRLAGEFASSKPAVAILPGKGGLLNGSMGGVYAAMAIHCLNALIGSIDTSGGILTQRYPELYPWPETTEDEISHEGCQAERVDGAGQRFPLAHHAYQAVADRILEGYPVEVLFLYNANPVYETPGGEKFVEAFQRVPLIVSFASFMDESAKHADLVLPEPTFLERYEDHFLEGLGYPGVGLRQPVIKPRYDTLSTGDFFLKVASKMGNPLKNAFPWNSYEEVLKHRLSQIGTSWENLHELGVWMTPGYRFARRGSQHWIEEVVGRDRQRAPRDGYFDFYSRELRCLFDEISIGFETDDLTAYGLNEEYDTRNLPHYLPVAYSGSKTEYPFMLNIVTLMSLGPVSAAANMPTLQEISGMTVGETWGSWLEMNPQTAQAHRLQDRDIVWVESQYGKIQTRVRLVKGLHPEVVNLPYNQGHTGIGRWAKDRGVNGLTILDPSSEKLSGLAAFTNTRVRVYRAV
jgi:menaquinone reductase, molybdopterin-binding-like subunit